MNCSTSFSTPFPTFIICVSVSHGLEALTNILAFPRHIVCLENRTTTKPRCFEAVCFYEMSSSLNSTRVIVCLEMMNSR